MSRLLVRNGRVIDPASNIDENLDVLIDNGRIAAVAPAIEAGDAATFDASDCVVAPGFIDIRAHLREPGIEHAETIETGSQAAAAGGFTTVCCLPNTIPVNDSPTVTSFIVERASRCATVHVRPIGALTQGTQGEQLAEFGAMKQAGVVALSDGQAVMNARVMRRALEYADSFGLTVLAHCEDTNLSMRGDIHEGEHSVRLGLRGIPSCAEDVIVARDIHLAELTRARLHLSHISTASAMRMLRHARQRGAPVTCEVTPHHLALTHDAVRDYDSNYKIQPPLRSEEDRQALIAAVSNGTVDAIVSDHSPHTGNVKMQEFERCPFGIIGFGTAVALAIEQLVHSNCIPLNRLIELFTTGPAKVIGLDAGTLATGARADITILDLKRDWTFDVNRSHSKSKNSPFDQHRFQGGPAATIVGGTVVWRAEAAVAA